MSNGFVVVVPFSVDSIQFEPYYVSYCPFSDVLPPRSYDFSKKRNKRPLVLLAIGQGRSMLVSQNPVADDLRAFCARLELIHNDAVNDS